MDLFAKIILTLVEHYSKKRPDLSPYHAAISDYRRVR